MGDRLSLTAGDLIVIIVSTVLALICILFVIDAAEEQLYTFGIRPSESASTDIAGLITLAHGFHRKFKIEMEKDGSMQYNVSIEGKLVCVSTLTRYKTTDCASMTFDVTDKVNKTNVNRFKVILEKSGLGLEVGLE